MKKLNSNHLKIIAIIAMTIDHFTWLMFPGCQKIWYVMLLHIIGRLTAPIMWFFIVEFKKVFNKIILFCNSFTFCILFSIWNIFYT